MPRPAKSIAAAAEPLAPVPANLFAGTSGWAYPTWKPDFYPAAVPARSFLAHYATQLTAVEVNYSFRKLPTPVQLAGWLQATPPTFRFSFKAPQGITHFKRLRDVGEPVEAFLASLAPVQADGRLGPLLFQLPPNFKAAPDRLAALLALPALAADRGFRCAFEFRHPSWFCDEVYALLRTHNAALCIADTDDLQTPEVHTANFFCFRLRKDGGYSAARLRTEAKHLAELARTGEVYAFFRHQDEPTGALNAVSLLRSARKFAKEPNA